MIYLSNQTFQKSRVYIFTHCSELIRQRWIHAFEHPNTSGVLQALSAYQNPDGGFGHNLEGDFLLPDSSAIATSVAFQILINLGVSSSEPLVQRGIAYLLKSYLPGRPGWLTVPPEINDYPHASWWHYKAGQGGSSIDQTWGNPTAELAGYLVHYRSLVPSDVLNPLISYTLDYFKQYSGLMEMHELFCFYRLIELLPPEEAIGLRPQLINLINQVVCRDPASWKGYCAQPLDFVRSPQSYLYPFFAKDVEANLDFRIETLTPEGIAPIPWNWENYPAEWEANQPEITGRSALENLILLKLFNRLAKT
jgi:hypothetical protein